MIITGESILQFLRSVLSILNPFTVLLIATKVKDMNFYRDACGFKYMSKLKTASYTTLILTAITTLITLLFIIHHVTDSPGFFPGSLIAFSAVMITFIAAAIAEAIVLAGWSYSKRAIPWILAVVNTFLTLLSGYLTVFFLSSLVLSDLNGRLDAYFTDIYAPESIELAFYMILIFALLAAKEFINSRIFKYKTGRIWRHLLIAGLNLLVIGIVFIVSALLSSTAASIISFAVLILLNAAGFLFLEIYIRRQLRQI